MYGYAYTFELTNTLFKYQWMRAHVTVVSLRKKFLRKYSSSLKCTGLPKEGTFCKSNASFAYGGRNSALSNEQQHTLFCKWPKQTQSQYAINLWISPFMKSGKMQLFLWIFVIIFTGNMPSHYNDNDDRDHSTWSSLALMRSCTFSKIQVMHILEDALENFILN